LARVADVEDQVEAAKRFAEQLRVARSLRADWPPGERVAVDDAPWERIMQEHDAAFLQRHQSLDLDASEPDPAA
jgi:hypothetical protein